MSASSVRLTAPSSPAGDDGQHSSSNHEEEVYLGADVKDAENEGHISGSDSRS